MQKRLNFVIVFLILLAEFSYSQISVCSWNLKDLGQSKSESELNLIADIIKNYDVIAIQEVVSGSEGPQAVARLHDILNRKGSKWEYSVSNSTSGSSYKSERYAFIWKPSKLTLIGKTWLEEKYNNEIDREPFYATFQSENKRFTLVNFHAITKAKQPETEIKYFKYLPDEYPNLNLIFCGDFNLPQSHTVFNPLKVSGYHPILKNQKTSLRQKCLNDDCLASEYDNIFYNSNKITLVNTGVIHFYKKIITFENARLISDHIPLFFHFKIN